jgi:hypothetical protein
MNVAADELVGRDYHSGGMLLPDGRVLVFGGNPLFADAADTQTAGFEQRLEIYEPPYLFTQGQRPVLDNGPTEIKLGSTDTFTSSTASAIVTARLIPPSSTTHATNVEQRSIALSVTHQTGGVVFGVPQNSAGTPSIARWVHVS